MIDSALSAKRTKVSSLDLYSTSQTDLGFPGIERFEDVREKKGKTASKKHRSDVEKVEPECVYHAPYFAYQNTSGAWNVKVGCCNHWDCPKCGITRAKTEYWRIVQGSQSIVQQGKELWFVTITTRGAGLSVAEAEANYLQWTNRLLTNLRQQSARQGTYWCYVQVTERQRRMHPHSHILTTYRPLDIFDDGGKLFEGVKEKWEKKPDGTKAPYYESAIRSDVLQSAICSSGLGEQYDLSRVRDGAAVARYIGKYLFKSSLLTHWPEGWRRVRYSHNWPKTDLPKTDAIALIKRDDWLDLAHRTDRVRCPDFETARKVRDYMFGMGVYISSPEKERTEE